MNGTDILDNYPYYDTTKKLQNTYLKKLAVVLLLLLLFFKILQLYWIFASVRVAKISQVQSRQHAFWALDCVSRSRISYDELVLCHMISTLEDESEYVFMWREGNKKQNPSSVFMSPIDQKKIHDHFRRKKTVHNVTRHKGGTPLNVAVNVISSSQ